MTLEQRIGAAESNLLACVGGWWEGAFCAAAQGSAGVTSVSTRG
jgi:hypothetical protein